LESLTRYFRRIANGVLWGSFGMGRVHTGGFLPVLECWSELPQETVHRDASQKKKKRVKTSVGLNSPRKPFTVTLFKNGFLRTKRTFRPPKKGLVLERNAAIVAKSKGYPLPGKFRHKGFPPQNIPKTGQSEIPSWVAGRVTRKNYQTRQAQRKFPLKRKALPGDYSAFRVFFPVCPNVTEVLCNWRLTDSQGKA
jgi:hypothetical protein